MIVEYDSRAVRSALGGEMVFAKFLSANDTGLTGAHQAGVYVPRNAAPILFDEPGAKGRNKDRWVRVAWQDGTETDTRFIYYGQGTRNEYRITNFGRGFPYLRPEYTGALFVFVKRTEEDYEGFFLNTEGEIDAFLDAFGLSPAETNRLVDTGRAAPEERERAAMARFIATLEADFPETEAMSAAARAIEEEVYDHRERLRSDPDRKLVDWTVVEYRLFRAIEQDRYGARVAEGFSNLDEFVELANTVLNRRKSRAGKSLEHHLAAIFDANGIEYDAQARTERNNRPDFLFPSLAAYNDLSRPVGELAFLSAKTTCKDRWRQILEEADRFKGETIYLCTLQQGNSPKQLEQMAAEHVVLVVPRAYIKAYPEQWRGEIWTLKRFVDHVAELESAGRRA